MSFDPENPVDIGNLRSAIDAAADQQSPFVKFHHAATQEIAGNLYGGRENEPETVLPEAALLIETLRSELMARPPQIDVRTFDRFFQGEGDKLKLTVNNELRADEPLFLSLQKALDSSFVTLGIIHVGVDDVERVRVAGRTVHRTKPYGKHILLEDFFHDMRAARIEEGEFQGHFYEMNLEKARENENFDSDVRSRLKADKPRPFRSGSDELSTIGAGQSSGAKEIHDRVGLMNVWIPEDKLFLVLPQEPTEPGDVLQIIEWTGPEHGPYCYLGYRWLDGNTMPLSLFMLMMPIHITVNNLARKLRDSAEAFKRIGIVQGTTDPADVENVMKCVHGEVTSVSGGNPVLEQTYGGIDRMTMVVLQMLQERFSYYGGGLDIRGGLAPQAETLGQEQILRTAASVKVEAMRDCVVRFVRQVVEDYAFWLWRGEEDFEFTRRTGGIDIPMKLTRGERDHSFWKHHIDIQPYSMAPRTPQQRFLETMQILDRLAQYWPMFAQQGAYLDCKEFLRQAARDLEKPELADLIKFGQPLEGYETAKADLGDYRPPVTNRVHTRLSGRMPGSQSSNMLASLLRGGGEE